MAAINNFRFKSFADLQTIAESYKDTLLQDIQNRRNPSYEIADISKEEFDNITTFLFNASIKDSKSIERNENNYSKDFSRFLKRYFEEYLSLQDIVNLKIFVNEYNKIAFNYFYNNLYSYVFGVKKEADPVDNFGFFKRNSDLLIKRIGTLVDGYANQTATKPVEGWFKGSGSGGSSLNIKNFYNSYFKLSKVSEAVMLMMIASYEKEGTFLDTLNTATTLSRSDFDLLAESFYNSSLIDFDFKDISFDTKAYLEQTLNSDGTKLNYFAIRSTNGVDILSVPYQLFNSDDDVIDTYNYLTTTNISSGEISLNNLFLDLYKQLMTFVGEITLTSNVNPIKINDNYNLALSYFENNNKERALLSNITQDIVEQSRLFYNKDSILENYYITTTELEKNSASVNEISISLSGKQLVFIDVKGIDFSKNTVLKNLAVEAFGNDLIGSSIPGEEGEGSIYKLTYTILYKELNSELRYAILSDIQEYKFARLFSSLNYSYSDVFAANEREYSYSSVNEVLYRNYKETRDIFKVDVAFSRYRLFNGNAYTARVANESEIIGYYVGDSTSASAFTNNYGSLDFHRYEIDRFLNIYQQTRDYYYKVLLNKSFINDTAYSLYEKLFIS
jgi:hypothetical protein